MAVKQSAIQGKVMPLLTWVGVAIGIVAVCVVIVKVSKAFKAGATTAGDLAGAMIVSGATGIPVNRQYVCKEVAWDCEDSITRLWGFGWKLTFNKQQFADALNRLETGPEAKLTSELFRQIAGESLKAVISDMLYSDPVLSRIKPVIKTNIT